MKRSWNTAFVGSLSLVLVSCGDGGPSADEAKTAIDQQIQSIMPAGANFKIPFKVTDISCSKQDASTFRCDVTKETLTAGHSVTVKGPYLFSKQGDLWVATPAQ